MLLRKPGCVHTHLEFLFCLQEPLPAARPGPLQLPNSKIWARLHFEHHIVRKRCSVNDTGSMRKK